ncbi:MAG: biotin/lipoyl-containing protein [Candidatus Thermoplasmatota archaeon]
MRKFVFISDNIVYKVEIDGGTKVNGIEKKIKFSGALTPSLPFNFEVNDKKYKAMIEDRGKLLVFINSNAYEIKEMREEMHISEKFIKATMPGKVVSLNVCVGSKVEKGDILLILEAMKMENEIRAPLSSKVLEVNVEIGESVNMGDVMVVLE